MELLILVKAAILRHRRGPDGVSADLVDRASDRRQFVAEFHGRKGPDVRDRDPNRRDVRGDLGVPGQVVDNRGRYFRERSAQRFALNVAIAFTPAVVFGLAFGG